MKKSNRFPIVLAFIFISTTLFSCQGILFNHTTSYQKNTQKQTYDAIIVPGVPLEDSSWSYIMKGRVIWSAYLYHNGITKNIIYSGSDVYSPYVEAKIMALYAEKLGVNPEHIFVETKAEHSTENVYYSTMIAKKMGFTKVALATDKFQSRLLASFLSKIRRKTGVEVKSLPLQEDLMATMPHSDPVIDYPLAGTGDFVSIVERESRLKRFWGTLGYNIKYEENSIPRQAENKMTFTN